MSNSTLSMKTQGRFGFPTDNPFVGLRPYDRDESYLFFGRHEQATELMQRLAQNRFLSVVGSSGCGKSSLVRAGLIPKLKAGFMVSDRDQWREAILQPGAEPKQNLAAALLKAFSPAANKEDLAAFVKSIRSAGLQAIVKQLKPVLADSDVNLLLLVDQFEETFAVSDNLKQRDEAADFVSLILGLAEQRILPIYVVITMRSDFLGECDRFYGLPEAMNQSQYLVPRLTRQQRQQAIEGPIRLFGQTITPRLIDRVLNDTGEQSDQLPVMQHAMMRTWDNWLKDGATGPLDWVHYEKAGTLKRALSNDADRALDGLGETDVDLVKRMFQALTKVDARNRATRDPRRLSELVAVTGAGPEKLVALIDRFRSDGRSFLHMEDPEIVGDPRVDISHESLIRQWQLLGQWIEDEAESREVYLDVIEASEKRRRIGADLWDGPELELALRWYDEKQPTLAWARRYHNEYDEAIQFLKDSELNSLARRDEERARAQKEKERARQLRWLNLGLALMLLASSALMVYAFSKRALAESRKNEAEKAAKLAEAAEIKAKANEQDAKTQKILALQSRQEALRNQALADQKAREAERERAEAEVQKNLAERQKQMADRRAEEIVMRSKVEAKQLSQLLGFHADKIRDSDEELMDESALLAAQSLKKLVSGSLEFGEQASLLPAVNRPADQHQLTFEGHRAIRPALAAMPLRIGEDLKVPGTMSQAAFGRDGRSVIALAGDRTVRVWDLTTGQPVLKAQTPAHRYNLSKLQLSQSGNLFATVDDDYAVRIWSAHDGRQVGKQIDSPRAVSGLAFSQDDRMIAIGGGGSVRVYELSDGRLARELKIDERTETARRRSNEIYSLAFDPTREELAVGLKIVEQTLENGLAVNDVNRIGVQFFDLFTGYPSGRFFLPEPSCERCRARSLAFSPDGSALAIGNWGDDEKDSALVMWNLKANRFGFRVPIRPKEVFFSRDGQSFAAVSQRRLVKIGRLEWKTPESLTVKDPLWLLHEGSALAAAFVETTGGKQVEVINGAGVVRVWETARREKNAEVTWREGAGKPDLTFTSEGRLLVSSGGAGVQELKPDDQAGGRIWTADQIRLGAATARDAKNEVISFSADGRYLAATTGDNLVRVTNLTNPQSVKELKYVSPIEALALSPDGSTLVTANMRDEVAVQKLNFQAGPVSLPIGGEFISMAFCPDGEQLVTVAKTTTRQTRAPQANAAPRSQSSEEDKTLWVVKIWDLGNQFDADNTPSLGREIELEKEITAIVLSSNALRLGIATRRRDDTETKYELDFYNCLTGQKELREPIEHTTLITALALSPDGNYLAMNGAGLTELWEIDWKEKTRQRVAQLKDSAQKYVFSADGASNGKYLAAVSGQRAWIWLWRPEDLTREICSRLGRNFSYEEWKEFLADRPYLKTCEALPVHATWIEKGVSYAMNNEENRAIEIFREAMPEASANWLKEVAAWYRGVSAANKKLEGLPNKIRHEPDRLSIERWNATLNDQTEMVKRVKEAMIDFRAGVEPYERALRKYNKYEPLDSKQISLDRHASALNQVCWWGSLYLDPNDRDFDQVLNACRYAVKADPLHRGIADSLGVALMRKGQFAEAKVHLRAYIGHTTNEVQKRRRDRWINCIDNGKDPLTNPEELKALRRENNDEKEEPGEEEKRNFCSPNRR